VVGQHGGMRPGVVAGVHADAEPVRLVGTVRSLRVAGTAALARRRLGRAVRSLEPQHSMADVGRGAAEARQMGRASRLDQDRFCGLRPSRLMSRSFIGREILWPRKPAPGIRQYYPTRRSVLSTETSNATPASEPRPAARPLRTRRLMQNWFLSRISAGQGLGKGSST